MRILLLNADYPRFLAWLYNNRADLENATYEAQMAARNASLFGAADFYSRGFARLGHVAADIHVNNRFLQSAWARQHRMSQTAEFTNAARQRSVPGWLQRVVSPFKPILRPMARRVGLSPRLDTASEQILLAQIEAFKPDVVINQDVFHIDTALMRRIKQIGAPILVGQVGIEPSRGVDWTVYDLMISQLPRIVRAFRGAGVEAAVNHLAFEPSLLEVLPPAPPQDVDVSFVGSLSADHLQRVALLEAVAKRYTLKIWGSLSRSLPSSSPLYDCFQGEVWGADMYQTLRRSKITLNSHIDIAGREAGNLRLFEATGVGAFLLTDFKDNLHTLFEPNREVATWRSIDECLSAIADLLSDDSRRASIATSGQARTNAQHTYQHRVKEILALIEAL
jgi:spore maturation protein CgeB